MKKLSFVLVVFIFVFSAYTVSAATVYNHGYCAEATGYSWDCDFSFTWASTCAGGGDPCNEYQLNYAPSINVSKIAVYIKVSKYTPLASNNWYYWGSANQQYYDSCTTEGYVNSDATYAYYQGTKIWGAESHVIGPGTCPEMSMHKAMSVYFNTGGVYYWSVYRAPTWSC